MRERTRPTVSLQPEHKIKYHQWTWNSVTHVNPKSEGQGVDGRKDDRGQGKGGGVSGAAKMLFMGRRVESSASSWNPREGGLSILDCSKVKGRRRGTLQNGFEVWQSESRRRVGHWMTWATKVPKPGFEDASWPLEHDRHKIRPAADYSFDVETIPSSRWYPSAPVLLHRTTSYVVAHLILVHLRSRIL